MKIPRQFGNDFGDTELIIMNNRYINWVFALPESQISPRACASGVNKRIQQSTGGRRDRWRRAHPSTRKLEKISSLTQAMICGARGLGVVYINRFPWRNPFGRQKPIGLETDRLVARRRHRKRRWNFVIGMGCYLVFPEPSLLRLPGSDGFSCTPADPPELVV